MDKKKLFMIKCTEYQFGVALGITNVAPFSTNSFLLSSLLSTDSQSLLSKSENAGVLHGALSTLKLSSQVNPQPEGAGGISFSISYSSVLPSGWLWGIGRLLKQEASSHHCASHCDERDLI